jgi:hypothetical protein
MDPQIDVTTGELYRLIQSMDKKLDRQHADMVGRAEYEADQEGIDRRFEESGKVHTVLETKVAAVDTKVDAKVAELEKKAEAAATEQRRNRSNWTLSLVVAGVGAVLSFIGSAVLFIQGGA